MILIRRITKEVTERRRLPQELPQQVVLMQLRSGSPEMRVTTIINSRPSLTSLFQVDTRLDMGKIKRLTTRHILTPRTLRNYTKIATLQTLT